MTDPIRLPPPDVSDGAGPLLDRRRSSRAFAPDPLSLDDLAALVWAAGGLRSDDGRTTPSAHALHPLSVLVVAGTVDGLAAGASSYDPDRHALDPLAAGDHRGAVAGATLADEGWLAHASALLVLHADVDDVNAQFADQPPGRGERYVWIEAGCAAQNVYLAAAGRGLGAVLVAGVDDDRLRARLTALGVPAGRRPLAVLAIGRV